jgi:hypothetical protein
LPSFQKRIHARFQKIVVKDEISAKRLINRRALLGEELRSTLSNVETVFEADAELAIDNDCRFVAKAHTGLNQSLVTTHKVCPFMSIEADAVARAMRQAGRLVVRTETRVGDYFARGRVDGFARRANFGSRETCVLRFLLEVPDLTLTIGWFTEDERARNV